jgi:diaminopimelate decarboxylase
MKEFDLLNGTIHAEAVPLPLIASAVGTPVFVYSTAAMKRQTRAFKDALARLDDPLIAFAVKANPNAAVLATLAVQGLGADVVSGGEYLRARAAGIPGEKIVFSGVGKTAAEMALALERGIYQFNLESLPEAEMLSEVASSMGVTAPVALRINPDVAAGSHAKISTGSAQTKFGIPMAGAKAAFAQASQMTGLSVRGVAVHIGSQLTNLDPFRKTFERLGQLIGDLRSDGHQILTADLGGGLGIPYDPALPLPPSPSEYGALVREVTEGWGVRLIFEPGRLIVGEAGVLLTEVIRTKEGPTQPFVIVDAGMNDLMRPTLYDAWHQIDAVVPSGTFMVADIVGPVCETGDIFAAARTVDTVGAGDLMIVRTAGAYAATMASTYNSRPLAAEVLVNGSKWSVVRERQDVQALIDGDNLPDWLQSGLG